jgi:hypothetical protein
MYVWMNKLENRVRGEEIANGASSGDEDMLDWFVLSVESGWTPRRVMVWLFPDFGSQLFDIIACELVVV